MDVLSIKPFDTWEIKQEDLELLNCQGCHKLIGYIKECDMNGNYVFCPSCAERLPKESK